MGFWDFFIKREEITEKKKAVSESVSPSNYLPYRRPDTFLDIMGAYSPFDQYATPSFAAVANQTFQLWFQNPIAKRIIEIIVDFVIGDGFELKSKNREIQNWLDDWSSDPEVDLQNMADKYANDAFLLGEYILYPIVNQVSGFTRYEPIDPTRISTVYQKFGKPNKIYGYGANTWKVASIEKDPYSGEKGAMVGDVLMMQINSSTMLSRGYSILQPLRDWLSAYDEFVFSEISRAIAIRKFLIDVEVIGASQTEIDEYKKKYTAPPESGTVIFHNEFETWDMKTPGLNAGDSTSLGKLILRQVLAGGGIAEHWLAEGGDVNKATAQEMAKPILRRLTRYQNLFFNFIDDLCTFARDRAILAGAIPGVSISDEDIDIVIIPDTIDVKDESIQWNFFNTMMTALINGVSAGIVTDGEARKSVERFLGMIGIESENLEKAADEKIIQLYETVRNKRRKVK